MRTARLALALAPRLFGYLPRTCNICDYRGRFLAEIHFPDIFTYDAVCPACGALPRHRLAALAIADGVVKPTDRMLHFAPEAALQPLLRKSVADYVTTDIDPARADVASDIENLHFEDGSWDVILCSHVLEHVDHGKALRELHRVLAPGGRLLAMFPIVEGWPSHYENSEVRSGRDRGVHFGKDSHLRRFGRNIRDDFRAAGFSVEDFSANGQSTVALGLIPGEILFIGRKT